MLMAMEIKSFFQNKLNASILTMGTGSIAGPGRGYSMGDMSEKEAHALLRHAFDRGINVFDTAPFYGLGLAEERLGRVLKNQRDKIIYVSKSGVSWHDNGRVNMSNDPVLTLKMLEGSLRRLQSDYIDIYMVHWPDARVDIRYPLDVLLKAKQKGQINHIGLGNTNRDDLLHALNMDREIVLQSECNLFHNAFSDIEDLRQKYQLPTMGWGTFDKGILTGRVYKGRKFDEFDCRERAPWWDKKLVAKKIDKVEKLKLEIKNTFSLEKLCLNYVTDIAKVDTAICGFRKISDIDTAMTSLENPLLRAVIEKYHQSLL